MGGGLISLTGHSTGLVCINDKQGSTRNKIGIQCTFFRQLLDNCIYSINRRRIYFFQTAGGGPAFIRGRRLIFGAETVQNLRGTCALTSFRNRMRYTLTISYSYTNVLINVIPTNYVA